VLDQITDPQNVGAIFRSAAAFSVRAIVMQDRKSPPLTGVLAKAAAGAVDRVSHVQAVNIARAVEGLRDMGYLTVGLAGEAPASLREALRDERPPAFVLGAEGKGLRPAVLAACDVAARIPMDPRMESLNVSNAAAIALYEAAGR
jgi:23S rRNA (guanosine2251-2'-O)-methyltransferase